MTLEELAQAILALPEKVRKQKAVAYVDDHVRDCGRFDVGFQVSGKEPLIWVEALEGNDAQLREEWAEEED